MIYTNQIPSPAGDLTLGVDDSGGVTHLLFGALEINGSTRDGARTAELERQLREYFAGERREFELRLNGSGTPFQKRVWDELTRIPYGQTISYGELARRVGNPNGSRAVGSANGQNPISIIVPCHRVIGASGKLVGYGGGLPIKEKLLELERQFATQPSLL